MRPHNLAIAKKRAAHYHPYGYGRFFALAMSNACIHLDLLYLIVSPLVSSICMRLSLAAHAIVHTATDIKWYRLAVYRNRKPWQRLNWQGLLSSVLTCYLGGRGARLYTKPNGLEGIPLCPRRGVGAFRAVSVISLLLRHRRFITIHPSSLSWQRAIRAIMGPASSSEKLIPFPSRPMIWAFCCPIGLACPAVSSRTKLCRLR